jgi:hypothetical protein
VIGKDFVKPLERGVGSARSPFARPAGRRDTICIKSKYIIVIRFILLAWWYDN